MKDRMLLIMPFFMGYEEALLSELQKKYEVSIINGDKYIAQIRREYKGSKLTRGMRKLIPGKAARDVEKIIAKYEKQLNIAHLGEKNAYDVILSINGHGISNQTYDRLKSDNPNARMIIYLWDDADNLVKNSHVNFFTEKYSYNLNDCERFGMSYLPMYVQIDSVPKKSREYDIAIIGTAHENRLQVAKRIYEKYKDTYGIFVYMIQKPIVDDFFCHEDGMSYSEYLDVLSQSKAVVDIPFIGQNGPTTRFMDALVTETKVITTNKSIDQYEFYGDNVLIIDGDEPVIDDKFISKDYESVTIDVMTVPKWCERILPS